MGRGWQSFKAVLEKAPIALEGLTLKSTGPRKEQEVEKGLQLFFRLNK